MPDRIDVPVTISFDPHLLAGGTAEELAELLRDVRVILKDVRERLRYETADLAVSEVRAAEMLDISASFLSQLRRSGKAPPSFSAGTRVLYPLESLRKWVRDQANRAVETEDDVFTATLGPGITS